MTATAIADVTLVLYRPRWDELEETFAGLDRISDEFSTLRILLSGSNQDRAMLGSLLERMPGLTDAQITHRPDNLGFASGHNLLLADAFTDAAEYCLILNPDVVVHPGSLTEFLAVADAVSPLHLFGPSLRTDGATHPTVDSLGISWTASGRHFDRCQGAPWTITPGRTSIQQGVTGACLLTSRATHHKLVEETGHFFDDAFLAYREDAELGVRAGLLGIPSMLVEMPGFSHGRHVRGFERGKQLPDLLGVRNRFLMRWTLGKQRPGAAGLPTMRDVMVIASVIAVERRSLPGLLEAFRMRRYFRFQRRRLD